MAPKTGISSRKGKGKAKASTSESWEKERFISKSHQDHFYDVVAKKKVIPEVPFKLKKNEYPEIQHEIQRRGNHDQSMNPNPKNYITMVRGKYLDFSPENVRLAFHLPMMQGDERPYTRRVNYNQRLDQVLMDICVEGAQWRVDSKGKPVQLRRLDLKPVARGWLEFIQRSIIPTSNRSEVTVDRAIMIHSIMIGEEVEVHEVISNELYKIADKPSYMARLAFPHLICHLCYSAGVIIDGDVSIEEDKPITKKRMEQTREVPHGPQEEHEEVHHQQMPQGMHFPPNNYWEQLSTSLKDLSHNVEQLRVEHHEHALTLQEIREDQRAMREEQQRQGRDKEELKNIIGPSRRRRH
ncbi:uncharacterized protein DS421_10g304660 [Arachis hypogaea]|nr:uncharacterized protein DS421_10g304660 [Arachis hypogaea]